MAATIAPMVAAGFLAMILTLAGAACGGTEPLAVRMVLDRAGRTKECDRDVVLPNLVAAALIATGPRLVAAMVQSDARYPQRSSAGDGC